MYRGLIIFLILLGFVFIGGTIYAVFFDTSVSYNEEETTTHKAGEGQTFTGIGRIRVPTSDSEPGIVIIFVSFTYHPDDKAFSEELVLRVRDFRQITFDYFSSFSVSELQKLEEDILKQELLRRFNAILRLGQIETLYFSDFMVLG